MASEYLRWKYRDVKPDEPPPPLTGWAWWANWLHYNKLWIAVAAVLVWILGGIVWNALNRVSPDYRFAYIGSAPLTEEIASALEEQLAALGEDVNSDGRTVVELRQYARSQSSDPETAMYYGYAADVRLVADINDAESYFFLVEDPVEVQLTYQIFANPDGTPPEDTDFSIEGKVVQWKRCPALAALAVEQETVGELYIGRRCFYDEKQGRGQEANERLWQTIAKGAES